MILALESLRITLGITLGDKPYMYSSSLGSNRSIFCLNFSAFADTLSDTFSDIVFGDNIHLNTSKSHYRIRHSREYKICFKSILIIVIFIGTVGRVVV